MRAQRCSPIRPTARVRSSHVAPTASGWNAPPLAPWLVAALDDASVVAFGQPTRMFGVGGTIPFMGMLGERFPDAQFAITGVLGPDANAHGPNEYLHLPTARKITLAIAELLNSALAPQAVTTERTPSVQSASRLTRSSVSSRPPPYS